MNLFPLAIFAIAMIAGGTGCVLHLRTGSKVAGWVCIGSFCLALATMEYVPSDTPLPESPGDIH